MKKAIITGATGMIGSTLAKQMLQEGYEILAVVRPGTKKLSNLPVSPLLSLVECAVDEIDTLPQKVSGHDWDCFFHLAWADAFGGGRNDMDSQIGNITGTVHAARAAAALGCTAFVGAGSQAEYGRVEGKLRPDIPAFPENGYGMAKLCAGEMSRTECKKLGLRHIWVRILSIYGPGDNPYTLVRSAIETFLDGKPACFTAGEQLWDYLYSEDAARAILLAGEKGRDGAVYPLGGGSAKPLKEYILTIRNAIAPEAESGLGLREYPEGQVMHLEADISALTQDTGFVPQIDFETGIGRTIDWVKEARA